MLFAATDVGVFDRKDGDTSWYKISVGLPNVPMMDLKLSGDGKELIVGTFGRSLFKLPLSVDATDGGGPGGSVPATLSLTLGTPASFGAFVPGVGRTYTASTTANVISSAGDATLSVSDSSRTLRAGSSTARSRCRRPCGPGPRARPAWAARSAR